MIEHPLKSMEFNDKQLFYCFEALWFKILSELKHVRALFFVHPLLSQALTLGLNSEAKLL